MRKRKTQSSKLNPWFLPARDRGKKIEGFDRGRRVSVEQILMNFPRSLASCRRLTAIALLSLTAQLSMAAADSETETPPGATPVSGLGYSYAAAGPITVGDVHDVDFDIGGGAAAGTATPAG